MKLRYFTSTITLGLFTCAYVSQGVEPANKVLCTLFVMSLILAAYSWLVKE